MEYQERSLNKNRTIKRFSFLGLIISGNTIEWSCKLFGYVSVEEELFEVRYLQFDDGWSYQYYWGPWKKFWKFKKFNK